MPPNEANSLDRLTGSEVARTARECDVAGMRRLLHSSDPEVLLAALVNPHFEEPDALFLLHRKDLPPALLQELATMHTLTHSYAVKLALAKHPKAPLHIALEQLKFLFLFDLVSVCLQPGVLAPVKRASEQVLKQIPKTACWRVCHARETRVG